MAITNLYFALCSSTSLALSRSESSRRRRRRRRCRTHEPREIFYSHTPTLSLSFPLPCSLRRLPSHVAQFSGRFPQRASVSRGGGGGGNGGQLRQQQQQFHRSESELRSNGCSSCRRHSNKVYRTASGQCEQLTGVKNKEKDVWCSSNSSSRTTLIGLQLTAVAAVIKENVKVKVSLRTPVLGTRCPSLSHHLITIITPVWQWQLLGSWECEGYYYGDDDDCTVINGLLNSEHHLAAESICSVCVQSVQSSRAGDKWLFASLDHLVSVQAKVANCPTLCTTTFPPSAHCHGPHTLNSRTWRHIPPQHQSGTHKCTLFNATRFSLIEQR